jgi:hypothetical protein
MHSAKLRVFDGINGISLNWKNLVEGVAEP